MLGGSSNVKNIVPLATTHQVKEKRPQFPNDAIHRTRRQGGRACALGTASRTKKIIRSAVHLSLSRVVLPHKKTGNILKRGRRQRLRTGQGEEETFRVALKFRFLLLIGL